MSANKILIVNKTDPRLTKEVGGVNTHVETMFKILKKIDWDYDVYQLKTMRDFINFKKINNKKYQVIYVNISIYDKGIIKLIAILNLLKSSKSKVVIQFHGGLFSKLKFKKGLQFFYSYIYRNSDLLITLNNIQYKDLLENFKLSSKVIQIPNFIDVNTYTSIKNIEGNIVYLFVGRIVKEKGIFDAINAFKLIEDQNVTFKIVGEGPDSNEVLQQIKNDNRIKFLGAKFDEEKEEMLRESHVFILPSYAEGFPYSILEAMNFEMPVIGSKTGGILEIIEEGSNGFLSEINNPESIYSSMVHFQNQKELILSMGKNAKETIKQNYSLEIGSQLYKKLLTSILEYNSKKI